MTFPLMLNFLQTLKVVKKNLDEARKQPVSSQDAHSLVTDDAALAKTIPVEDKKPGIQ